MSEKISLDSSAYRKGKRAGRYCRRVRYSIENYRHFRPMVRFPYTLEMWYEEDASQNPDGSWIEGAHEWRVIGRCNARQNGRAQQIKGQNGDAFLYSFEVTMPADTQPIPIGTKVRIFDSRGFNIFDRSLRTEAKPKDKDTASYPVQGFYKSGQRYENTRLWL